MLQVNNLNVQTASGQILLKNCNFSLKANETLAILGKSGSGKSLLAKAILDLLPAEIQHSGEVLFNGKTISPSMRGREIGLILQNPMTAFDPLMTLKSQFVETLQMLFNYAPSQCVKMTQQAIENVQLPANLLEHYPNQLSGGQLQRMVIALTLLLKPKLIIADEPTSSLDAQTQAELVPLFQQVRQHSALIFITHDLALAKQITNHALVIDSAEIVEKWAFDQAPQSDAGKALLYAYKALKQTQEKANQYQIKPILTVTQLCKSYRKSHRLFSLARKEKMSVLSNISFSLNEGEILGLVGKSGSGKSTLSRLICGINTADSGEILLFGKSVKDRQHRKNNISIVFQDYLSSINPTMQIWQAVSEPLENVNTQTKRQMALAMLQKVGLDENYLGRYPYQLSGGQAQRVCIARALISHPKLVILDEAVSSLDVVNQRQILDLLLSLKAEFNLSYLFISHNLNTINYCCNRILFLENGTLRNIM